MKTSRQYLLWLVVVAMFCAVCLGGCGGSSDNNDSTDPTDDSGGRNQDGWEDVMFEEFAGAWEITSITMGLNGVELYPPEASVRRVRLNATASDFGGNLSLTKLDGTEFGHLTSPFYDAQENLVRSGIVILASGAYQSTSLGNVFRQYPYEGQTSSYYQLLGSSSSNGYNDSLPWNYVHFETNYVDHSNANNSYTVRTVLKKIPDSTLEDVSLVAGNWRIVSASLQVRGSGSGANYVLNKANLDTDLKLAPMSSTYLAWTQNLNAEADMENFYPLSLEFTNSRQENTEVILLDSMAKEYTLAAPNILVTARTGSANNPIDYQYIEGIGIVPWNKIRISRIHYAEDTSAVGVVESVVTATFQRIN